MSYKKILVVILISFFIGACGSQRLFEATFPPVKTAKSGVPGKLAPVGTNGGVLFRFQPKRKAKNVTIAGSFNGWDKARDRMEKAEDGSFSLVLVLPAGQHQYKFLEDGAVWMTDPANPAKSEDGNANSLVEVSDDGSVRLPFGALSETNPGYWYRKPAVESPDWIREAVIYELSPRAYTKEGFRGLKGKLPYLAELGVNTLWVMPINPVGLIKRKGKLGSPYSVKDYMELNPEFGSKDDFRAFVDAAHKRGFRVVVDWVANHSAWDNANLTSHPDWYVTNVKGAIIPPNADWSDVAWLNYQSPGQRSYMLSALRYWVSEFGIDGYRFDVAGMVPLDFWTNARAELRKLKPDVFMLAESEEERHNAYAFDLTYEGGLRTVAHDIALGKKTQLDFHRAYRRQKFGYPKGALRMHWLENHDQQHALKYFGKSAIYPAAAVLLGLDGVPLLHMGQEIGDTKWKDWKSLFDAIELDWDKTDAKLLAHYRTLVKARRSNPELLSGGLELIENDNEKCLTWLRMKDGEKTLVAVNLTDEEQNIALNPEDASRLGLTNRLVMRDLLPDGGEIAAAGLGYADIPLKAWQARYLKMETK